MFFQFIAKEYFHLYFSMQLYTLHGMVDGQFYPFLFALLPGRSEDVYNLFFPGDTIEGCDFFPH